MLSDDFQKEIQDCVCQVVVVGPEANDEPGFAINEPMDDNLPSDQPWKMLRHGLEMDQTYFCLPCWPSWCQRELTAGT
jgi:hypothetical protein